MDREDYKDDEAEQEEDEYSSSYKAETLDEEERKALKSNLGLNSQRHGYEEYLEECIEKLNKNEIELDNSPKEYISLSNNRGELERIKWFYENEIEKMCNRIEKIENTKGYSELDEEEYDEELQKLDMFDRKGLATKNSLGSIGLCNKDFYDLADEYHQIIEDAAND